MWRPSIVNLMIFAMVSATCNYNSILAQPTVDYLDDVKREETSFPWRYLEKLQQQMEKLEKRHEQAVDETRTAFREFLSSAVTPASLRDQLQQQETRLLASFTQCHSAQQEATEASLRDATENIARQLTDAVRSINQQQVNTAQQTEVKLSDSLEMLSAPYARLVEVAANRSQEERENVESAVRVLEEKMESEFLSFGGRLSSTEQQLQRQNESLGVYMETMKDSVVEMWDATSSHMRRIERNMTRNLEQFQQQRLADDETHRTDTANAFSRLSLKLDNLASNNSQQHEKHRQLSEAAAQNITRNIGEQFESIRGNISALDQRLETYRQTQDDVLTMQTAALSQLLSDAVDNVTERLQQSSDVSQQQQQLSHLREQLAICSSAEDRLVTELWERRSNETTAAFAGIRQLISDRQLTLEQLISRNLLRLDETLLNVSNLSSGHQQQTDRHHSEILGNVRELLSTVRHAFNATSSQLTDVGGSATRQHETTLGQQTQHARELTTDVGRIAEVVQSSGRELRQQLDGQMTVLQRLTTEVVVNLSRAVDVVGVRCYSTEEGHADRTRQTGATANLLREVQMTKNRTEQERERERQQLTQMESGMSRELQLVVGELRQQRQQLSALPTARVLGTQLKSVEEMCNITAQRMISISEEPVYEQQVCPQSFQFVPAVNGCYLRVSESMQWDAAALNCLSLHNDSHLLFINSAEEQQAIQDTFATVGFQCYIGAQRVDPSSNSAFVWKHSTLEVAGPLTFTNWATTQPDYWRQSESCVHLLANGKWNDLMCTDNICSICEIDLHE